MYSKMIGFAVLALLTTSCSQNDILENQAPSNVIKFVNLNDRISSRSANDSNSDYGIYAFLNNGNPAATTWFMNNQQIDGNDNSYSPLKYWPSTGNLDFYAYAPHSSGNLYLANIAWNATTPVFDVVYTIPANADEDFTIAAPVAAVNSGQVQLLFSHMLSKLNFNAELSNDLSNDGFVLNLNSVKLKVVSNQGNISLKRPQDGWSNLTEDTTTYNGAKSYMIIPQPTPDTEITLNVSITHNGEDYFMNKELKTYVLTGTGVANFAQGTQYLFKITVGDTTNDDDDNPVFNVINFTATSSPWVDNEIELPTPN